MAKYSKQVSKPVVFPQINQIYRQRPAPTQGTGGDMGRVYSGQGVTLPAPTGKTITPQGKKANG